ncbi:MAG: FUSC family protein [Acidobacteriaceae bacterium]|nr:FUSC family protein [Acidobacteriaceae bacterium]
MASNPPPAPVAALWRSLTRLDRSKINSKWLALRNSAGVAAPLAIGMAFGNALGAVAVTTGALNVSYSDGRDPYSQRARRMLAWTILGAVAVFVGSFSGATNWVAVTLTFCWAFTAGLMISISTRAGDLGLNTLVALIVFAARGVTTFKGALYTALLVLLGGLLQTALALLSWPLRRYQPERRAVAGVYLALANEIGPHSDPLSSTPLKAPSQEVQDTLDALGRDYSTEGERFRLLLDQADRIRMSAFVLARLRDQVAGAENAQPPAPESRAERIDKLLVTTSRLLAAIGECLTSGECATQAPDLLAQVQDSAKQAQSLEKNPDPGIGPDAASAIEVLAGQLRAVAALALNAVPAGLDAFARLEMSRPWKYQMKSWIAILRANLDPRSAFFRHAIRLAVWVSLGDAIGRSINGRRAYWIPMTIAVVLKPDFGTTFSRGVLRLAGTFAGLGLATLLYHFFPESPLTQLFLVGTFTFLMRFVGPANYGLFSVAITGLIVFLIAATGVSPREVVLQRGANTAIGGLIALAAYALWPTWERTQVSESLAEMLDAARAYFRAVVNRFTREDTEIESRLDETRRAWRRARSAAEASADRVASEPGISAERLQTLTSILASSYALVHAIMAIEAGAGNRQPQTAPEAFETFATDVEFTLYFLATALRGSPAATQTLPKLREDHSRLVAARDSFSPADEFILSQTDVVTTSLNSLREQVMRYIAGQPSAGVLKSLGSLWPET